MRIIFTAYLQPSAVSYFITIIEIILTIYGYGILYYGWKVKTRVSYLVYGFITMTLPTLTGTFSSMPRYLLSAFPIFIILGTVKNITIRYGLISISIILQIILSALFVRGWFVG